MKVIEERCLPSLGEDTRTSSRSRRIMVVFLAFLRPSSRDLSVSTSTSSCKQSKNQSMGKHCHKINHFTSTNTYYIKYLPVQNVPEHARIEN